MSRCICTTHEHSGSTTGQCGREFCCCTGVVQLSEYDHEIARRLYASDLPFNALIGAALMRADTANVRILSDAYPDIAATVREG